MVSHAFNPGTGKMEAGRSEFEASSNSKCVKFQASQAYIVRQQTNRQTDKQTKMERRKGRLKAISAAKG